MRKAAEEKAKLSRQKFPIHFVVSGQLTACGLEVSRLMAVTGNHRRTTCCRCIDTNAYDSAAAANTRSDATSDGWKQQTLFGEK